MITQIFFGLLIILFYIFSIINKRGIKKMGNNNLAMILLASLVFIPIIASRFFLVRFGIEINDGTEPGRVGTGFVVDVIPADICPISAFSTCIFIAVPKFRKKTEGNNAFSAWLILGAILSIFSEQADTIYEFISKPTIISHSSQILLGILIMVNGNSFNKKDFIYLFILILIYLGIAGLFTVVFGLDKFNSGISKNDGISGSAPNNKFQPGNGNGQFFIFTQILQIENVTDTNIHLIRFFGGMMMLLFAYVVLAFIQLFNGVIKKYEVRTNFDINKKTIYEKIYYKYSNKIKEFKLKKKK